MKKLTSLYRNPLLGRPRGVMSLPVVLLAIGALAIDIRPAVSQELTASVTNSTAEADIDAEIITRAFTFTNSQFPAGYNVITDVNINVEFGKALDDSAPFAYLGEIRLTLSSPSGVFVNLINFDDFDIGEENFTFNGFVFFDDSAAAAVNANPSRIEEGTFRPVDPLSAFNGLAYAPGTWTLAIEDAASGAPMSFTEGTLFLTVVPEPGTNALLLGAALIGGGIVWRRRRANACLVPTV